MLKSIKKLLFVFYALIVVVMGAATVIEKYNTTDFVAANIYPCRW